MIQPDVVAETGSGRDEANCVRGQEYTEVVQTLLDEVAG